ncbi:flavodoxin [Ruminococcus sp.]
MSKKLVAYFSASEVTAKLAKTLAEAVDGELFEIVPETPYTAADVNWVNPVSRCNKEKVGKKDVPIKNKVEDMDSFDTLFIGFPIWYWAAPNIINTFVKQYDLSGKKIVLFATSGGSDIGKTAAKIKPYLSEGAEIVDAKVLNGNQSVDALKKWAESLGV